MTGINEENLMSLGTELSDDELEGVVGGVYRGNGNTARNSTPVISYAPPQPSYTSARSSGLYNGKPPAPVIVNNVPYNSGASPYLSNNVHVAESRYVVHGNSTLTNAASALYDPHTANNVNIPGTTEYKNNQAFEKEMAQLHNHQSFADALTELAHQVGHVVEAIGAPIVNAVVHTAEGAYHDAAGVVHAFKTGDVGELTHSVTGLASVAGVGSFAVQAAANMVDGGNSLNHDTAASIGNAVRLGVQVATGHGAEGMLSSVGITNQVNFERSLVSSVHNVATEVVQASAAHAPTPAPAAHAPTPAPAPHAPTPAPAPHAPTPPSGRTVPPRHGR